MNNNKQVLELCGYFDSDTNNIINKVSQIKYNFIYKKKKKIINLLTNKNINKLFVTEYLRNKNIKYLLLLSINEYASIIENNYNKFIELNNSSFMNIVKIFINKDQNIENMYNIIALLLIGNNESQDQAGLLFTLIKEKKYGSIYLSEYIYRNLTNNLQIKLNKIQISFAHHMARFSKAYPGVHTGFTVIASPASANVYQAAIAVIASVATATIIPSRCANRSTGPRPKADLTCAISIPPIQTDRAFN